MTTVFMWGDESGIQGQCDARCHNANPGTPCECMCGGKYHAANTLGILEILLANEGHEIEIMAERLAKSKGFKLIMPDEKDEMEDMGLDAFEKLLKKNTGEQDVRH